MVDNSKLHILGAGPAGLATGYYAKKNNISFKIYERSNQVGGNCKTICDGHFRFDTGAHRFHDKYDDITSDIKNLMGDELKKVNSPSKIYHQGKLIDFPLNLFSIFTNLDNCTISKIIIENICNMFTRNYHYSNFKEHAYHTYGKTLSELFLINYTEKLWGSPADKLDIKVSGNRLKNLDISSLFKQLIFSSESVKHLDGSFYYPVYGFGTIFEKIKNSMDHASICYNAPITKLYHNGNNIIKISDRNNTIQNIEKVISTLPVDILVNALEPGPPKEIKDIVDNIHYRNLYLCVIYLDTPYFTNNASIYFPESIYPFTRIYEPKNRSIKMAPNDKTCIVIEIPYDHELLTFTLKKEQIYSMICEILLSNDLIKNEQIIGYKVMNIKYAYPTLNIDSEKKLEHVFSFLSNFENLYTIGRSAKFVYTHTHDIFKQADLLIKKIL
ncbi:MAG: hypothetical protein CMG69_00230 [Candidatus Marinimicrobia bacterium]|nr:hypothetical protein [Candidatus Neomarinimicrobiota bacterium]|tara:strand:- start:11348 stop:12673 length:1326 start_codon:yes stop_codon:yes gene_type:complete